jgi:hypothetical protein
VPQGEDLDAAGLCVDLVVEVVTSPAQKKAADTLPPGVASSRSDARLRRDEFERSLEIVHEGKWSGRTIGSPPHIRSPDLGRGAGRRLDGKACGQGLLAKFSEQGLCINELTPRCFIERLLEGSLLLGCQLKGLVGFRNKNSEGGSLLE